MIPTPQNPAHKYSRWPHECQVPATPSPAIAPGNPGQLGGGFLGGV